MKEKPYKLFCSGDLIQACDVEELSPSEARSLIARLNIKPGGTDQNPEGKSLMRVLIRGCEEDTVANRKTAELEKSVASLSSLLEQQQKITKNLLELFIISVGGTPPAGDK